MTIREVTFPGVGGARLSGLLDLPDGQVTAHALFAHCFTCSKRTRATVRVCRALSRRGVAVLRFDFSGLGDSDGDFETATFSSSVADLVAAADWMRRTLAAPDLLIGHSLGGAAVLAAASRIPEAIAVATVGAPADTAHVAHLLRDAEPELQARGVATVEIAGRPFTVRRELLDDLRDQPQRDRIENLDRALLVMHSPQDETVGIDNARLIYEAARHPKSFVALDGAGHLLERDEDAHYVAAVIAAWAGRYLPMLDEDAPALVTAADAPLDGGVVEVHENGRGRFGQTVRAGSHEWPADEPTSMPGALDGGPGPFDHLLAALGTCTSMTIRMYADRKGWPLQQVRVVLRQDTRHAPAAEQACADDAPPAGGRAGGSPTAVKVVVREVGLIGDLTPEQRARLLEIADKCPVHRTLESGITVVTSERSD